MISNQLASENTVLSPQIIGQIASEGSMSMLSHNQQSGLLTQHLSPGFVNSSLVIGQDGSTFMRPPPATNPEPPALTPIHIPQATPPLAKDVIKEDIESTGLMDNGANEEEHMTEDKVEPLINGCRSQVFCCFTLLFYYAFKSIKSNQQILFGIQRLHLSRF